MPGYQVFLLLYVIATAIMYFLFSRSGGTSIFPGDIYIKRGPTKIYFPVGSALFLAIFVYVIFLIFKK